MSCYFYLQGNDSQINQSNLLIELTAYLDYNLQSPTLPFQFSSNSSGSSVNSPVGPSPVTSSAAAMANPYSMGPLSYHSPSVQSYCSPADNLSLAGHYTDMRSSAAAAGWYGTTTNDPRFASKLKRLETDRKEVKCTNKE